MKRILLPTDFSDNSKNAMLYALEFFKGHPSHFILLNVQKPSEFVLDDFYTAPATATLNDTILTDNKKALEKLSKDLTERYAKEKYTFRTLLNYDTLTNAITEVTESQNIDLIVMGSNGATGASEVIFGSNTLKVIRKVDHPTLIIPEGYTFSKLDTLLISLNHNNFNMESMKPVKEIIQLKNPKVTLLNLDEERQNKNEGNGTILEAYFEHKISEHYTLEGLPLAIGIDAFIQLNSVQMHALFLEKEGFLKRFLLGSATSEISYNSRVPLLVLR